MRYFKYGKKEHLMGLINLGKLRIGTLSDYRRVEHAKGISDPSEGTKELVKKIDHLALSGQKDWGQEEKVQAKMLSFFGIDVSPNSGIFVLTGVSLHRKIEDDAYVYCFSIEEKPSLNTMKQFEGADFCVEIVEPEAFFQLLRSTVAQMTGAYRAIPPLPVEYRERTEECDEKDFGLHPGLIKGPQFRQQFEGRILWQLPFKIQTYAPFLSGHCHLGSFCKVVDLKSSPLGD